MWRFGEVKNAPCLASSALHQITQSLVRVTDAMLFRTGADFAEDVPVARGELLRLAARNPRPRAVAHRHRALGRRGGRAAERRFGASAGCSIRWRKTAGPVSSTILTGAAPRRKRTAGRRFTYSAALCHVALDRGAGAVRLGDHSYPRVGHQALRPVGARVCGGIRPRLLGIPERSLRIRRGPRVL
jgi:hypothetical protein